MPKFQDLTGRRFGKLTVIERAETKYGKTRWLCKCDCGKYTITIAHRLLACQTRSCGCTRDLKIVHGMTKTRLHNEWSIMKRRCLNKNDSSFDRYGGRGIKICDEWKNSFMNFMNWALDNGYNDNLSIERVDVNGDYCPENCKWITMKEQAKNKRNSIIIEHNGETKALVDWCQKYEFPYDKAAHRYRLFKKQNKKITLEGLFSKENHNFTKVEQYDKNGKLLKVWNSIIEATSEGYSKIGIINCCKGRQKSSCGYIWKYSRKEGE
jgi:hypothetical protein